MKIYEYRVEIDRSDKITWKVREWNVLGQNEEYLAINDLHFTTLAFNKSSTAHQLEKAGIMDMTTWSWSSEKFELYLYTKFNSIKKAENKINHRLVEYVTDKISPYLSAEKIRVMLLKENQII